MEDTVWIMEVFDIWGCLKVSVGIVDVNKE
jgi:hypothetical protein